MSADSDFGLGGGCFVVPLGMPHLAPVLEPGAGVVFRRYLIRFLRARDRCDPAAEREISDELYARRDDPEELLCGLFSCAETTARELYGAGARSAVVQAARRWRDCPAVNAAGVDPEMVRGYLSAAEAVDCMLAGDSDTAYALIDRVLACWSDVGRGGRVCRHHHPGRATWGDAAGWIDTLDYLNTGQGEEPNIAVATGPPLLLRELAAELDEPEVPSSVGEVRTRDILAGARLATSFLCYRDADATVSQQAIHEWLQTHPGCGWGFIGALAGTAQMMLRVTTEGEDALGLTRELTQLNASRPPRPRRMWTA